MYMFSSYFSEWFTEMAPLARLPFTYNAQRALYDMTYDKASNYWDLAISPDLKILHYSGSPKPWEVLPNGKAKEASGAASLATTTRTGDYLTDLWRQWYQRSKKFVARHDKQKEREQEWKASAEVRQKQQEMQAAKAASQKNPKQVHKLVSKRFKELRQEGYDVKTAMAMARAEHGLEDQEPASVGAQVASMFGVMM